MDDLIQRYCAGELTDLELGRLRAWRKAAPENEARFNELVRLWELSGPGLTAGRSRPPAALRSVLSEAERRRDHERRDSRYRMSLWWAVAATVVLAAGGGWLVWRELDRPKPLAAAEFSTGEQETVTVALNDGSFVRLGPKSRLAFTPHERRRDVWLDGRAYFAVARDPARPFQVRTRAGLATVLGTRFEVVVDREDMRLAVVEGRVSLAARGDRVEVGPGEVSHVRGQSPPSVMKVEDIHRLLDWPKGILVFQATPLPQVASELGRHFGVRVVLDTSKLGDRVVTAWFESEKLEVVLTTICRVTQTTCVLKGDSVTLTP